MDTVANPSEYKTSDAANHQSDLSDFWTAMEEGRLPSVGYLKAAAYQDGHPGYSDPIDGQFFVVNVINALENRPMRKMWRSLSLTRIPTAGTTTCLARLSISWLFQTIPLAGREAAVHMQSRTRWTIVRPTNRRFCASSRTQLEPWTDGGVIAPT